MSKEERRLWLGDWQGSEPTDSVVITPDDEEPVEPPQPNDKRRKFLIGAGVAALCVVGFILGTSGNDDWITSQLPLTQTQPTPVPQVQAPQSPQQQPPGGFGGPDQTDADAIRAAQAALDQFPGEIERVTGDPTGGGWIVHVIQADGNEVHVQVDRAFHVQGSDADQPPQNFGPGRSQ